MFIIHGSGLDCIEWDLVMLGKKDGFMILRISLILIIPFYLCSMDVRTLQIVSIPVSVESPRYVRDSSREVIASSLRNKMVHSTFPYASEELSSTYSAKNLTNTSKENCWAFRGVGAWVMVYTGELYELYMLNGLWKSDWFYFANNRVKTMRLRRYLVLQDKLNESKFSEPYLVSDETIELPDNKKIIHISISVSNSKYVNYMYEKSIISEVDKAMLVVTNTKRLVFQRIDVLSVYRGHSYNDTCLTYLGDHKIVPLEWFRIGLGN